MAESDARANQKHVINFAWPYYKIKKTSANRTKKEPAFYYNSTIKDKHDISTKANYAPRNAITHSNPS